MSDKKDVKMVEKSKSTNLGYQPKREVRKDGYQPTVTKGFQPFKPANPKPLPNVTSSVQTPNPTASSNGEKK